MRIEETSFPGLLLIRGDSFEDDRGRLFKNFQEGLFQKTDSLDRITETFYTISHQDVIRGMHFQLPPHHYTKLVTVISGSVTDVSLDLRMGSPTYGRAFTIPLDGKEPTLVFLPPGFAHGFSVSKGDAIVYYMVSSEHVKTSDSGIRWDSFGFEWGVEHPIISKRDMSLPRLAEFETPFHFEAD